MMMDDGMNFGFSHLWRIYGVERASIHDIDHYGVRKGFPYGVVIHGANIAISHDENDLRGLTVVVCRCVEETKRDIKVHQSLLAQVIGMCLTSA